MSIKKTIAVLGACAMLCGMEAARAQVSPTLKKIKETNSVTLGVRDTSVPFSYLDGEQQYRGYSIDLCMKVVAAIQKELGLSQLKVNLNPVTSATRIPLMANGTIDIECASTTNNLDRQKQVSFAPSHFLTASKFVAKKADHFANMEALRGKTVASVAGTSNIVSLNQANVAKKLGMTILAAKDVPEGFLMMETGRAVAFVMDDIQLSASIANSKDPAAYEINEDAFSKPEPYGIMLRRNDPPFKAMVDRAITKIYASPDITAIYNKWFMSPVAPKGVNYNAPLSPALRNQFAHPTDSANPDDYKR